MPFGADLRAAGRQSICWRTSREAHISAEPARPEAPSWLPRSHVDQGWSARIGPPPLEGPQAPVRLTGRSGDFRARGEEVPVRISTLKKRSEFQRVRGGGRYSCHTLVVEGKARPGDTGDRDAGDGARFGFTITKKLGGAVLRNRIRRRFRAALTELGPDAANPRFDYVIVARSPAHDLPFHRLCEELSAAIRRVNESADTRRAAKAPGKQAKGRLASPKVSISKDTAT